MLFELVIAQWRGDMGRVRRITGPGCCSLYRSEESDMQERLDRRTVAKGGALTGFAAALALLRETAASPSTPGSSEGQSLYDRLGGIFAIAAVVNRFSDAIIVNPKLNINP